MAQVSNYLPEQYARTGQLEINHNYLTRQFAGCDDLWDKLRGLVARGDFTLGSEVDQCEAEFAAVSGTAHAIGVGSGTDALFLSLKALGVGHGDEVITTPYTFYATIGAIVTAGARPVFADVGDDANIDPGGIADRITPKTKAIMVVHWSGRPCEMDPINAIARQASIRVVEDACHAINATYRGRRAGSLGDLAGFSFHPLKNINVWGDGGMVATSADTLADRLRLLRNHGLVGRDECQVFAYNSRLDTLQAVVARYMLKKVDAITDARGDRAAYFDAGLGDIAQLRIPSRPAHIREVYHLYMIRCQRRDELQRHLIEAGIDAKVHYPTPMHLQPAAREFGYRSGDFPNAERVASEALSLPVHEFITRPQQDRVIDAIREFYR